MRKTTTNLIAPRTPAFDAGVASEPEGETIFSLESDEFISGTTLRDALRVRIEPETAQLYRRDEALSTQIENRQEATLW
jgi:hypothetical protein